jgi:hypothetical protein
MFNPSCDKRFGVAGGAFSGPCGEGVWAALARGDGVLLDDIISGVGIVI